MRRGGRELVGRVSLGRWEDGKQMRMGTCGRQDSLRGGVPVDVSLVCLRLWRGLFGYGGGL